MAAMRNPISPLAIIAVPTMEAGYRERDFIVAAVACEAVETTELTVYSAALCEALSLDCLVSCSPSVARAMPTAGMVFDSGLIAVFPAPNLKHLADLTSAVQLHCGIIKRFESALIFVAIVPERAGIRTSHMAVTSFPISIKIVNMTPRQITAPVNMCVTGIEKPIEA